MSRGGDGRKTDIPKPIDPKSFLEIVETGASSAPAKTGEEEEKTDGAIDAKALLARFGGNRKLLQSLIQTFRDDCPQMMAKIRSAVAARNARALADASHGLKGSVGNFGVSSAFGTAREMEKTARQGKHGGAWELYATW